MAYFIVFDNVFGVLTFQCVFSFRMMEQFIVNFPTNLGSDRMRVEVFSLNLFGRPCRQHSLASYPNHNILKECCSFLRKHFSS